ncbi:MAG: hypothetical protein ACRERV_00975 [Methylococcales bacterium]
MNQYNLIGPAVFTAVITYILKFLTDRSEKKSKRINAAKIILIHLECAARSLKQFVPEFKKDTTNLIKSKDAHFFTPANESLDKAVSLLESDLILLPSDLVSYIMLFNSWDISINQVLREMSHKDFVSFDKERKEKIVNFTIGMANDLIPIAEKLILDIEKYVEDQNNWRYWRSKFSKLRDKWAKK